MCSVPLAAAIAMAVSGCAYRIAWPDHPTASSASADGTSTKSFAVNGASRPNYFQRLRDGRVVELAFDDDSDGTMDEIVDIASSDASIVHFVVILDGVPFDLVERLRNEGRFQLFGPPVRMVSVFPAMTDLALSRIVRSRQCVSAEAQHFDRERNSLSNGNDAYMSGGNAPWRPSMQYCAPQRMVVTAYLNPPAAFSTELRGMHRVFDETKTGRAMAYSVGTAGLGTRGGEQAIRDYLVEIDKLCERVTYDRRGKVRFTLLADHGHTLRACERVSFRKPLTEAGFRVGKSLERPNDVVPISYGLVNYAQFHTDRPGAVAAALLGHPAVDLAVFPAGDAIVVRKVDQAALVRKAGDGFVYECEAGDPLELLPIIDGLRSAGHVGPDGEIADRPLLAATARHRYPDPLHRLWSCFHDLVDKPADVIVSLEPEYCHGSKMLHFFAAPVASTHGGLDYGSSVTFLMTNATNGPLPPVIRVDDAWDYIAPHGADAAARD